MSQLVRARSVRQRWRGVCVVNCSTPERSASFAIRLDQVQIVSGFPKLRFDSDRNSLPRSRLICRRCPRYRAYNSLVGAEYGTTRSRRPFVFSARMRTIRCAGSMSPVSRLQSSSRRSAQSYKIASITRLRSGSLRAASRTARHCSSVGIQGSFRYRGTKLPTPKALCRTGFHSRTPSSTR